MELLENCNLEYFKYFNQIAFPHLVITCFFIFCNNIYGNGAGSMHLVSFFFISFLFLTLLVKQVSPFTLDVILLTTSFSHCFVVQQLHPNNLKTLKSVRLAHYLPDKPEKYRSSHQMCSVRKVVLRNFAEFIGKCFPMNFAEFLRTPFLTEHVWVTASGNSFYRALFKVLYKWIKI